MVVRLKEWVKPLTSWDWVEITDNNVLNLRLRDENNLIIVNEDHEAYVDLQLPDWIANSDNLPIGVNVGRVLQADGRPVTWTLLSGQTTSGDRIKILYGDDGEIKVDNGTGTWKDITTAYFKTQTEYDNLPNSKNSDWNLYIIVDNHLSLMPYSELVQLSIQDALTEVNTHPQEYVEYYYGEWDVAKQDLSGSYIIPSGKYAYLYNSDLDWDEWLHWIKYLDTDMTEQELIDAGIDGTPWEWEQSWR